MFTKNVGPVDRALRVIVGLVLLALFFAYPESSWRYFALLGIVPLLTAVMSSCPMYSLLGISSCPAKKV